MKAVEVAGGRWELSGICVLVVEVAGDRWKLSRIYVKTVEIARGWWEITMICRTYKTNDSCMVASTHITNL